MTYWLAHLTYLEREVLAMLAAFVVVVAVILGLAMVSVRRERR